MWLFTKPHHFKRRPAVHSIEWSGIHMFMIILWCMIAGVQWPRVSRLTRGVSVACLTITARRIRRVLWWQTRARSIILFIPVSVCVHVPHGAHTNNKLQNPTRTHHHITRTLQAHRTPLEQRALSATQEQSSHWNYMVITSAQQRL